MTRPDSSNRTTSNRAAERGKSTQKRKAEKTAAEVSDVSLADVYPETPKGGQEPKKVARALRQREGWAFPIEEESQALELVPARDPDFKRTRSFVNELADDHRLGLAAGGFGAKVIASEVGDSVSQWPPSEASDPKDAAAILERIAAELGPRASDVPKKGDKLGQTATRRAHNALMIATEYLSVAMGLAAEDAVPVLRSALGAPSELSTPRSNRRRLRMRALTDGSLGRDRLRGLLELLQPWIEQLREVRDREAAAIEQSRALQQQVDELSSQTDKLRERIRELENDAERARQEGAAASDRLRDTKALAMGNLREVRGRTVISLDTRVRPKLEIAAEAASLDPPRPRVIQRKLADALAEIEEQVEWLRSSD